MGRTVYVTTLPGCDFLCLKPAEYDFRTKTGQWANGCEEHYREHRASETLGTGYGQHLVEGEAPERTDDDIKSDLEAAIEAGDFDAMEEALGDRDFAEFM